MGRDGCATCRLGLPVTTAAKPDAEARGGNLRLPMSAVWQNRAGKRIMAKNCNQIDISLGGRLREKRTATALVPRATGRETANRFQGCYAYETGSKRISADRLLRVSKLLGVKPVYFFGFDDNERPVSRNGALLTLPDQGLRLHRAFIGVKNPALREAIVSLVIELARNETAL